VSMFSESKLPYECVWTLAINYSHLRSLRSLNMKIFTIFILWSGWWLTYPSEKYDNVKVSWDDVPFPIWWESQHQNSSRFQENHQPLWSYSQSLSMCRAAGFRPCRDPANWDPPWPGWAEDRPGPAERTLSKRMGRWWAEQSIRTL
jgi:hypothetical protein